MKRFWLLFFLSLTGFCWSIDSTSIGISAQPEQEEWAQSSKQMFQKMVFSTVLIVALGGTALWFLRARLLKPKGCHAEMISIISKRPLSPKTTLYLIETTDRRILLAESASGVEKLGEQFLDSFWSDNVEEDNERARKGAERARTD